MDKNRVEADNTAAEIATETEETAKEMDTETVEKDKIFHDIENDSS